MSLLEPQRSRVLRTLRDHPEATGHTITGHLTRAVDRLLIGALEASLAARPVADAPPGSLPRGWALVALGGYGRGRMSLRSDVDIQLIPPPGAPGLAPLMGDLLAAIQGAGLKPGHGVRTVTESLVLAREEVTYATAVLGLRHIAGDPAVGPRLRQRVRAHLAGPGLQWLVEALERDRTRRAGRQGGTTYVLEPELKSGIGGLRDAQIVTWLNELLGEPQDVAVRAAEDTLLKVRVALHASASFNTNRLTFEYQEAVAKILAPAFRLAPGPEAVDRLMQRISLATRVLARHAERRLEIAGDRLRPSAAAAAPAALAAAPLAQLPGFITRSGRLARTSVEPVASAAEVVAVVRAVMAADAPPEARLSDALEAFARTRREGLEASSELRKLMIAVVTDPRPSASRALHLLHQTGLLARIIPEFRRVMGMRQRDLYHVFTVDEHSLRVVDFLKSLARGERAATQPLATELMARRPQPRALLLAGLLHDIGKGRGRDHHLVGVAVADAVAARLGLARGERELLAQLVRHQATLALTAVRRDLSDIRPIRMVARHVEDVETLDALYLLSVADWSSVGPDAFRDWQRRLLDVLYERVRAALLDPDGFEDPSGFARGRLEALLVAELGAMPSAPGAASDPIEDFCAELPTRYFQLFDTPASAQHLRLWRAFLARGAAVVEVTSPAAPEGIAVVTVVAADRPGLLSALAGGLASAGFGVLSAQIYSLTTGVLDVFHVCDPHARLARAADREALSALVAAALDDPARVARRLAEREAAAELMAGLPSVPPTVGASNAAATHHTVIDVRTGDRDGLLYRIAGFLHERGLTVHQAFVATEGRVAHDSFYVVDAHGDQLDDDDAAAVAEALGRWLAE